jgi:hypothetical protein
LYSRRSSCVLALLSAGRAAEFALAVTLTRPTNEIEFVPVEMFMGTLEVMLQVYGVTRVGMEQLYVV